MDETDERIPVFAREVLNLMVKQLAALAIPIGATEAKIRAWFRTNQTCRRLATIPGIGPIVATALVASVGDPRAFASGRNFAAWLGLTPRQNSTGGKQRLVGITKRDDGYLRRLLLNGTQAVLRWSKTAKGDPWLDALSKRKPHMVVAVALPIRQRVSSGQSGLDPPRSAGLQRQSNLPGPSGERAFQGR